MCAPWRSQKHHPPALKINMIIELKRCGICGRGCGQMGSPLSVSPVQPGDAFDVGRVGKEIEGLDGGDFVALPQERQIPG